MYYDHPDFKQPADPLTPLWRYMDFTKLLSLLESRSLYFARSDLLGDPFEGSTSRLNVQARPEAWKGIPPDKRTMIAATLRELRRFVYVSCWHANRQESAAMWRLYLKSNEGVAVRTELGRLKESIAESPEEVHIGLVRYLDYDTEWVPEGNVFYPFLSKRRSFEHEREVRAIHMHWPPARDGQMDLTVDTPDGVAVVVDLEQLIDAVYVAPTAPEWLRDLVASVTQRYMPGSKVVKSRLDDGPVF